MIKCDKILPGLSFSCFSVFQGLSRTKYCEVQSMLSFTYVWNFIFDVGPKMLLSEWIKVLNVLFALTIVTLLIISQWANMVERVHCH